VATCCNDRSTIEEPVGRGYLINVDGSEMKRQIDILHVDVFAG
jgi:hypothetical protein